MPFLSPRAVRPMRWMYCTMLDGKSTFTTFFIPWMSRPREATSVATRKSMYPFLNWSRACSRLACDFSPWMEDTLSPFLCIMSVRRSARTRVFVNTSVLQFWLSRILLNRSESVARGK